MSPTPKRPSRRKPREQRLDDLEALARTVAHYLNNVFAAILGCADLLAMRLAGNAAALEDAQEIQRAAERGAALTRQLHTFITQAPTPSARSARRRVRGAPPTGT